MNDDDGSNRLSLTSGDKLPAEDLQSAKSNHSSVTSIYRAHIGGAVSTVTVTWSRTLINHSLSVAVHPLDGGAAAASAICKIDLKPWRPFWIKKGLKSLELDGSRKVDVFWDLRSASFSGRPEPTGGFYVALVSGEVVALLLGDSKKEAFKRTKARPSLTDAVLVSRKENAFGRKSFSTKTRFGDLRGDHEIVIESSIAGVSPEMRISIDGEVMVHVDNLRWKFRGNETVEVEKTAVQILWDVHGWLFGPAIGLGNAVFIFKPNAPELEKTAAGKRPVSGEESSFMEAPGFCFMFFACKVE